MTGTSPGIKNGIGAASWNIAADPDKVEGFAGSNLAGQSGSDERIHRMDLQAFVHEVQDFPIPGVLFRDISPMLASPAALNFALDKMVEHLDMASVDLIVGIESRGFILGAALGARFGKGFVPLRKAGKLPPPVETLSYELEYGKAALEMRAGQGRVLVVDDVLATGGTLAAAIELCARAGYEVAGVSVLINLPRLNDMRFGGKPIHAVLTY